MLKLHQFIENINKSEFKGSITEHHYIADRTTMKCGGSCALFIVPADEKSLLYMMNEIDRSNVPHFILGGGSNTIVPDGELDAAVISTECLNSITIEEKTDEYTLVKCGAGVKTNDLVEFCAKNGIGGMETFAGLPGTVGGAAYMNARCYGKEIADVLYSAEYIEGKAEKNIDENCPNFIERHLKMYHNGESGADWAYKHSPFMLNHKIVTSLVFRLLKTEQEKSEQIEAKCRSFVIDRQEKGHFKAPSAGSVFKNDRNFGEPSGVLIDKAGLKGTCYGGASIAPWHGNIIINAGGAKSDDIKALVKLAQEKVRQNTGFLLEPEIIFMEQNLQ